MTRATTEKLVATVIEVTDLGGIFPASVFKGRIGLDVRIAQGSLSTGKKVWLHGPGSEEQVEIVGIEMLSNPHDPDVVRIICPKPKMLSIPSGKVTGWTIVDR
jgi:hypothetical protein